MVKLTVNEIKKQIAALEAKAARLAEEETKASVGKVRALMNQLGVTLEHLSSTAARKGAAIKRAIVGGKPKTAQRAGKGVIKYRDPATGATWTGFGRAPGWIAGAADRDAFLVSKGAERAPKTDTSAPRAKKRVAAKKATAKKAVGKKAVAKKAPAKKAAKTPVKRAVARKAMSQAAAPATFKRKPSIKAAATKAAAKKASKKPASVASAAAPTALDNSSTSAS